MKEFKIKPPAYFLIITLLALAASLMFPEYNVIGFPYNLWGLSGLLLGGYLNIWAWKVFMKNGTPENYEKPECLVTEGPYRFSRNPMHLGGVFMMCGVAVLCGNIFSFAAPLVHFVILRMVFIPYEEDVMGKLFGADFSVYVSRVRMWI